MLGGGHRNIQHTVRYTELSPTRFKNLWRDCAKNPSVLIEGTDRLWPTAEVALPYSITSSAVVSSEGGTLRPSALAVLRLITISNFVGV
jgi:hypothetical protein